MRRRQGNRGAWLLVGSAVLAASGQAAAGPVSLSHSGYLLDAQDRPLTGAAALTVTLWSDPVSTNSSERVWPLTGTAACTVQVREGRFAVEVGAAGPGGCGAGLTSDHVPAGAARWLELTVGGVTLSPRLRLSTVPTAELAAHASSADRATLADSASLADDALRLGGQTLGDLDTRFIRTSIAAAQSIGGSLSIQGDVTSSGGRFTGDGSGLTNLSASSLVGSIPSGLLPPADALTPGLVTSGPQTFGGAKTFSQIDVTQSLSVGGAVRLGSTAAACAASISGALRFNPSSKQVEFCNGTEWTVMGAGAAAGMSAVCSASNEGTTRYNSTTKQLQLCNGTSWVNVSPDTFPDPFAFTAQTGVSFGTVIASNAVTISGIDPNVSVSVSGDGSPQININGTGWVTSGFISPGQTLQVRLTSAPGQVQTRTAVVSVGSMGVNWSVTTQNSLYAFSSHTFTTCGASGQTGPAQSSCVSAYSGASWAADVNNFSATAGIQSWTVPASGTYRIEVWGARGGVYTINGAYGTGARLRGDFNLTQGQKLKILVGQAGTDTSTQAGGGGGTFVVDSNNSPLLIAGGGGGGYSACTGTQHGTSTSSGRIASYGSSASGGSGGPGYHAGGGGGLLTNGSSDPSIATYGATGATYGYAFVNGGAGGNPYNGSAGGFGGGGGSHSGQNAGGGGGGYSGGGGGYTPDNCGAGGGSYNVGTNQDNSNGESVASPPVHGQVTITKL